MILVTIIIYCFIALFWFLNILFNPSFNLILVHKKTKETKEPTIFFIMFFCLLWIIYIPLSLRRQNNER